MAGHRREGSKQTMHEKLNDLGFCQAADKKISNRMFFQTLDGHVS
jgi:hypothetical protein